MFDRWVSAAAGVCVAVIAVGAAGCTSDTPSYCDENTPCPSGQRCNLQKRLCEPGPPVDGALDAADGGDGPTDGPILDGPKKKNGVACQAGAQCESGFCADGVCCASACSETCRTCNAAGNQGTCVLVPDGSDPRSECAGDGACAGTCDGKGACRFPDTSTSCGAPTCASGQRSVKTCDGKGTCNTDTQTCGGYACAASGGACKTSCGGAGDCSGQAQCVNSKCVAQQPLGSPCGTNPLACASTKCTDGVCCSVSDCGKCKVCGSSGACGNVADTTSCGTQSCAGSTLTTPQCQSGACSNATSSCGRYQCDAGGTACRTACSSDAHCTTGNFCDGVSCVAKRGNGAACTGANQCSSGKCTDKVCCTVSDCGSCKACVAGTGVCGNLADGPAPTGDCPGDPGCNPNQCKGGTCDYAVNALCGETCSGSSYTQSLCSASGACTAQTPTSCSPYACDAAGKKCRSTCVNHSDCVSASLCDVTAAETTGQGYCVDTAKIKALSSGANLATEAFNAMQGGTITHLKLVDSSYANAGWAISTSGTITIVGMPAGGATITGPSSAGNNVIIMNTAGAELRLQNVVLANGGAADPAGTPAGTGDGIQCLIGTLVVVDSTIRNNETWGIRATSCNVTVRRSLISNNGYGGISHRVDGRLYVSNTVITGNRRCDDLLDCDYIGFGINTVYNASISYVPIIENVTIFANGTGATQTSTGGGITCGGLTTVRNAIVHDNDFSSTSLAAIANIAGNCTVTYTTYSTGGTVSGTGNVKDDCAIDSSGRPAAASSCINSGTSSTLVWDVDRTARLKGSGVDRGAYEVQ